jgi:hypothetical protein
VPTIHLSLGLHILIIILAAVAAAGIAYIAYKRTIPPTSRRLRIFLATIRGTLLFIVFLLIAEPLVSLVSRSLLPPTVAILIDNSRSLTIKDRSGNRSEILKRTLESPALKQLSSNVLPLYVLFDANTRTLESFSTDSLTQTGDATDFSKAFAYVSKNAAANIQAVLLITDGNATSGSSPLYSAEELGLPIFTIGIGDTSEQKDLLIRKLQTNTITYVDDRVPVKITVKSSGIEGGNVEVKLLDGPTVLDSKSLKLQSGTHDYIIPTAFTPNNEGMLKLTASVSSVQGELTTANNRASIYVKVLKSKIRVLLIAGAPSPDVSFLRRTLALNQNISATTRIERGNGEFYEGALTQVLLDSSECIILAGFPSSSSPQSALSLITNALTQGKGFFFLPSRTIDIQKLRSFDSFLPFITSPVGPGEFFVFASIPTTQRNNTLLRMTGNVDVVELWQKLAPVFRTPTIFRPKPEAEIVAVGRFQPASTEEPLILSRNVNRRKTVALTCYGLWRWKMFSEGMPGVSTAVEDFISNSVRWLTTREEDRKVRVQPAKENFSSQDAIEFNAQVLDEAFSPVDDAEIGINITREDKKFGLALSSVGNGLYEGSIESLEEGEYNYSADVQRGDKTIATDGGKFTVGGLNVEFIETRMNRDLLERIAVRTGGKYYRPEKLQSLPDEVARLPGFKPLELTRSFEIELWHYPWALVFVVLLLAIEWTFRRVKGMV